MVVSFKSRAGGDSNRCDRYIWKGAKVEEEDEDGEEDTDDDDDNAGDSAEDKVEDEDEEEDKVYVKAGEDGRGKSRSSA